MTLWRARAATGGYKLAAAHLLEIARATLCDKLPEAERLAGLLEAPRPHGTAGPDRVGLTTGPGLGWLGEQMPRLNDSGVSKRQNGHEERAGKMGDLAQTQAGDGEKLAAVLKPRAARAAPLPARKTPAEQATRAGTYR